jgi:hypothetical protein
VERKQGWRDGNISSARLSIEAKAAAMEIAEVGVRVADASGGGVFLGPKQVQMLEAVAAAAGASTAAAAATAPQQ